MLIFEKRRNFSIVIVVIVVVAAVVQSNFTLQDWLIDWLFIADLVQLQNTNCIIWHVFKSQNDLQMGWSQRFQRVLNNTNFAL